MESLEDSESQLHAAAEQAKGAWAVAPLAAAVNASRALAASSGKLLRNRQNVDTIMQNAELRFKLMYLEMARQQAALGAEMDANGTVLANVSSQIAHQQDALNDATVALGGRADLSFDNMSRKTI